MQSADFKVASFSFKLSKVGPGVFFALFGTFILYQGLTNRLDIKQIDDIARLKNGISSSNGSSSGRQSLSIGLYGSSGDSKDKKLILAINSLNELSKRERTSDFSTQEFREFKAAISVLNEFHFWKMNQIFTEKAVTKFLSDPEGLKEADMDKYEKIRVWMRERLSP